MLCRGIASLLSVEMDTRRTWVYDGEQHDIESNMQQYEKRSQCRDTAILNDLPFIQGAHPTIQTYLLIWL
jgi:hypothetical protein